MLNQETLMVTCRGCNNENEIPIENLLDYSCVTCGTSPLQIKETEQEILVKELDAATNELDRVIGNVTHGNMDPNMASEWLEYESGQIADILDKARAYIKDNQDKYL
ncbi:hypothetical protein [Bacillus sp. FJAT-28004]|uniref:hypothetical protein n=1 Tax=Bacillus sp. FJAT-28004 TaxID=1679165 RepID=UPI0006B667C0|nr:hypothetical protein [Bacillus sp. FJAT-28004]